MHAWQHGSTQSVCGPSQSCCMQACTCERTTPFIPPDEQIQLISIVFYSLLRELLLQLLLAHRPLEAPPPRLPGRPI
jgi:hypothetical protein